MNATASNKHTSAPVSGNGTRGERNNNPGNLRFDSRWTWQGQKGKDAGGYLIFDTAKNGIRAMGKDLLSKYRRGLDTIEKIIKVYAPEFENPTSGYIRAVATEAGFTPSQKLDLENIAVLQRVATAMIRFENGRVIYTPLEIVNGLREALR